MVLFNYAIREVTAKLVYYGPGLCGKTTNLQFIHEKLEPGARGRLLSLATDGDRTLFFDFLPIEMGSIGGYKVRFQLYTVPGQVHYNATRKLVLKGVDAVAFVADSQLTMVERNRESFENLIENLIENGYDPAKIPIVIQMNKRDLPNIASVGDLVAAMKVEGYPVCEAVAYRGDGVFETLKTIVKLTLSRLRNQFDSNAAGGTDRREAPAPARPPEPPPPPPSPAVVFAPPPPQPPPQPFPTPIPAPIPEPVPAPVPELIPELNPAPIPAPAPETFAPAATAPPEPEAEAEVSAFPIDGLDEFDLEYFADETPAPEAPASPEVAVESAVPGGGDIVDLEADLAALMEADSEDAEAEPGDGVFETAAGLEAIDEMAEAGIEPAMADEDDWFISTPSDDAVAPIAPVDQVAPVVAETLPSEPPPWAAEMIEEMQRLRAENDGLRDALRGIRVLLDRQIGVLQDGREELERHLGENPGESES